VNFLDCPLTLTDLFSRKVIGYGFLLFCNLRERLIRSFHKGAAKITDESAEEDSHDVVQNVCPAEKPIANRME